jgi:ArsR family transcriptional regulator, arsenate/arsenite/antimonite-responsive transcriptional repressor
MDNLDAFATWRRSHRNVQAGPSGAAGEVASSIASAPNMLFFHFDCLRHAGLVSVARQGRSLIA